MDGTAGAENKPENATGPENVIGKDASVDHLRGVVMLLAAGVALWKGWRIHTGHTAAMAYALAALALAMAAWHFTRKPPQPRA
jgi:hypothetical protein